MHTKLIAASVIVSMLVPSFAIAQEQAAAPYEKNFILTAYYSPLPDQCCYVKGSYEADKILNGEGTHGADGTAVYPGMIAAPKSYAFGTRIDLPGLGILTVHDRGGAIQEGEEGDRLDVWAGQGEEGLARALAFGVKRIRGTVYPPSVTQPEEKIVLEELPAPVEQLKTYAVAADAGLLDLTPKAGEKGDHVMELQNSLHDLGYLTVTPTGYFGDGTKGALAALGSDFGIATDGAELTGDLAAYLAAADSMKKDHFPVPLMAPDSPKSDIQSAQRLLRFLGLYRGRTDGKYGDALFDAVLSFQQSKQLVGDAASPGAGNIGPLTRKALTRDWQKKMIAERAEKLLALKRIAEILAQKNVLFDSHLAAGKNGPDVREVQEWLARHGLFPKESINGNYGEQTAAAVLQYQLSRKLIESETDTGAGIIGPATLSAMRDEQIKETYSLVRAQGWNVL